MLSNYGGMDVENSMPHSADTDPEWRRVATAFDVDLFDVIQTADGPYAVGASGTLATDRGAGWEVVLEAGPAADSSTLNSIAVTDDGTRVWFVGASGTIGAYNVETQRKYNYSYSGDVTTTWNAIAVSGKAESEEVLLGNGSGVVLPGIVDGADIAWEESTKLGGGSTVSALAFASETAVYAANTSGGVFKRVIENKWTEIGIADASAKFYDIHAEPGGHIYVAAGDGHLYRYDPSAQQWTPIAIGQTALRAIDRFQDHVYVLADSNAVYWRALNSEKRWQKTELPTGGDLVSLALGYPDIAVGKAGVIIVRPPFHPPEPEDPTEDPPRKSVLDCEDLLLELLTRLERYELIELIEQRQECGGALIEQLRKIEETEHAPVVVVPEARETHCHERGEYRREGCCESRTRTSEVDVKRVLDRICGC